MDLIIFASVPPAKIMYVFSLFAFRSLRSLHASRENPKPCEWVRRVFLPPFLFLSRLVLPPRALLCWFLVPSVLAPSGATAAARPFLAWLSVLWFLGARGSRGCGALLPVLSSCPSLAWAGLLSLGAWFALLWFLLS